MERVIDMATATAERSVTKVTIPKEIVERAFVSYIQKTSRAVSQQEAIARILEEYSDQMSVAGDQKRIAQ